MSNAYRDDKARKIGAFLLFHVLQLLNMVCFFTLHKSFLEAVVKPSHTEASALGKILRTIRTTFMELVKVFQPNILFLCH